MAESQNEATGAVVEKPGKGKTKTEPVSKPKPLPPYGVILQNDGDHSFTYVIEALQKTFGYSWGKAFRLTLTAHVAGRALVWSGSLEVAEFKRERLRGFGPDVYAMRPVNYPLGCVVEPLA